MALVLALILILANRPDGADDISGIQAAAPLDPSIPTNGRVMGNADAPVQVVEWGDYQCPGCAYFAREVEPQLIRDFVSTGQITYEFRDWAFLGPDSQRAAEAAFCAEEQGKFWQYHDTIFMNHTAQNVGDYTAPKLKEMARQIGLDMEQFNSCYDNGTYKQDVQKSYDEGKSLGVTGTPNIMINGQIIQWDGTYASLKAAIEQALAQ